MKKPELKHIAIDQLIRGKYQPRKNFDPEQLRELAESIKTTNGLLQPIVVRPIAANKYEIVAGERRWRAAQLAGLSEVSCLVSHYTDQQALEAAIIENINRADLNPIEEAEAYQRMIDEFDYLHEEVAAALGKSRAKITNALRLLKLDRRVQEFLITEKISEGHGKILAGIPETQQYELAKACVEKNWSVRKLELEVKKLQKTSGIHDPYSDPNIKRLEVSLSNHIGNRVLIECADEGGGYLKIRFNNIDELEGHFAKIGFEKEG